MLLIADGGSTTVKWALIAPSHEIMRFESPGVNPAVMSTDAIEQALLPALAAALENITEPLQHLFFYGAGCLKGTPSEALAAVLRNLTQAKNVFVASDMLGACRALLGHEYGIAAILGTGSNSCLFDGTDIIRSTPAGGYILGDEFSGAWLGKQLVADALKGRLPQIISDELSARSLSTSEIIRRVYRPNLTSDLPPNRFLASLAPIYSSHRGNEWVETTLRRGADSFVERNLLAYQPCLMPGQHTVNFVGSIAASFRDILSESLSARHFTLGKILPTALSGLISFHSHA